MFMDTFLFLELVSGRLQLTTPLTKVLTFIGMCQLLCVTNMAYFSKKYPLYSACGKIHKINLRETKSSFSTTLAFFQL